MPPPAIRTLSAFFACALIASLALVRAGASQACEDCLKVKYWTVAADAWRKGPSRESFPEAEVLDALRPHDLGVAFSGGGTRAAAAAVGQLRGLHRLGWLKNVRYVTAVSGGSWTAVPFTFSQHDPATLLGRSGLHPTSLGIAEGLLAQSIVDSKLGVNGLVEAAHLRRQTLLSESVNGMIDLLRRRRTGPGMEGHDKTFARLMDKVFLKRALPADASGRFFSWSFEANATITAESRIGGNQFVTAADRPFLIVGGTMIVPSPAVKYPALVPVEYTPLYAGVRQRFGHTIGGSYIRSWAYGSEPVAADGDGHVLVRSDETRRFTLADVIASSGAAPQLTLFLGRGPERVREAMARGAGLFPHFGHFTMRDGVPSAVNGMVAHGDGGFTDNLGVMPLLARGVRNVLVFVNSSSDFPDNIQLQSYFMPVNSRTGSGDKTLNKVFDERHWAWLMRQFEQRKAEGDALVACSPDAGAEGWRVLGNEHYNIGPYEGLRICWVYNHDARKWRETLKDVGEELWPAAPAPGQKAPKLTKLQKQFRRFPWFSTFEENKPYVIKLSAAQVNVLANLAEWSITSDASVGRITQAFGGALGPGK